MNQLKSVLILSFLLLVGMLVSGCNYIDKLQARDQLNKGVNSYHRQSYNEAEQHFQSAIQLDPELAVSHLYLATVYRAQFQPGSQSIANLQQAQKAIAAFQKVLDMDPDLEDTQSAATAIASISTIYKGLEDFDRAKEWQLKRVDLEPTNPEPLYGIGTIDWELSYAKTGMTGENVEHLTKEELAEVEKNVTEGIDVLKRALEIQPDYHDAMSYLNLLYREKAKLTDDDDEKKEWESEANKLALQALRIKRQKEEEAEKARRTFSGEPES